MRRPLNWVVVCISLLLLVANQALSQRDPPAVVSRLDHLAAVETRFPMPLAGNAVAVEFGYVRPDGTFEPIVPNRADDTLIDSGREWLRSPRTLTSASTSLQ
jgi:hypothetical protein